MKNMKQHNIKILFIFATEFENIINNGHKLWLCYKEKSQETFLTQTQMIFKQ